MITENNGRFLIETDHTSYLFYVDPAGFLTHLYYGEKLFLTEDGIDAMIPVISNQNGCSIIADQKESTVSLDDWCQEASSRGRGDLGQPMIELVYADGSRSSDFRFESFRIERIKELVCLGHTKRRNRRAAPWLLFCGIRKAGQYWSWFTVSLKSATVSPALPE